MYFLLHYIYLTYVVNQARYNKYCQSHTVLMLMSKNTFTVHLDQNISRLCNLISVKKPAQNNYFAAVRGLKSITRLM